jgi:DNA-binding transcriptional MocR family regulator
VAYFGAARTTIGQAFDVLRGDGVLVSRTGAGTFVSAAAGHATARGEDRLRSFVQTHAENRIDLRSAALPGVPMVAEEFDRLSAGDFAGLLDSHGYVPGGLPALRSAIAGYYADQGLPTDAGQILVTSGAQQATRLLAETLLEPGRTVVVEEPTFRGAISAKYDVPIIDDAAPADSLIDGVLPPPLATYGGAQVLTIGSASKGFWGGLRVGWVRADAAMVGRLTIVKGAEDLGTSLPAQVVTTRLLARTAEARSYRQVSLGAVRGAVLAKLAAALPEWCPLRPAGGASLWIQLPAGCSATAFAERAGRAGVDVLPGPRFSCRDELDGFLRVAFAAPPDVVLAGLDRLVAVWRGQRPKAEL